MALVSRDAVGAELETGRLVVIDAPGMPLDRPWHAVAGAAPSATTLLFVRHLLDAPGWSAPHAQGPDAEGPDAEGPDAEGPRSEGPDDGSARGGRG